jgi:hypothetical protein
MRSSRFPTSLLLLPPFSGFLALLSLSPKDVLQHVFFILSRVVP